MTMERFFASPLVARMALNVVVFLAIMMVAVVGFAASHRDDRPATTIHPCALVLDRTGRQVCR